MGKATAAVVLIIIIVIIGGVAGYYLYGGFETKAKKKKIITNGDENKLPTAFFSANDTGTVGELIWFDGNASKDPDGRIISYEWFFGDGDRWPDDNSTIVNHTYLSPGIFEVTLKIRDDKTGKDEYKKNITIRPNDYIESSSMILLSRVGIDNMEVLFPVQEFAVSLTISIDFAGATGGVPPTETILMVNITNSYGIEIGNSTNETRGQATIDFFFDEEILDDVIGDYLLQATCLEGSLYLDYLIEVRY